MLVDSNSKPDKSASFVLAFLFFSLIISACNPVTEDSANPAVQWSVSLEISGGFAGVMQMISLDSTGQAVFVDKKLKSQVEKQVTRKNLETYVKLIADLPVASNEKSLSGQCRDCFQYVLVALYDKTEKLRIVDSLSVTSSDARELITKLTELAREMKPAQ